MKRGTTFLAVAVALVMAGQVWAAEISGPIPGKIVVSKAGKVNKFVAKPISPDTFDVPEPGTAEDPTIFGAVLTFEDLGLVAGTASHYLGPDGWTGLGNPPGSKGYKYKGKDEFFPLDPECKIALIKAKVIKAVCKNGPFGVSPPFAGNARVSLWIPTDAIEYCAEFGGTTIKNDAQGLKRKNAPAPGACP